VKISGVPIIPLVALVVAGTVFAQSNAQTLSGGVAQEEREQMMQRYRDYNLHLAFAEPNGQYLVGVKVTVRDAGGNVVVGGVSDGPLLFASLPPGAYRVTAEFAGKPMTRTVQVGLGAAPMHYFRWDEVSAPSGAR
jgi:hypothetical protein